MAISDLPSPPEIAVRLVYSGILALCRVWWWLLQVECMFSAAAIQALMRWLCTAALLCAVATASGFQLGHPWQSWGPHVLTRSPHWLLQLAPTWALTILLAGLLTAITWKLIMRGLHTWSQESESMRQLAEARAALTQDELEQPLLASQGGATAEQGSQGVAALLRPARGGLAWQPPWAAWWLPGPVFDMSMSCPHP